MWRKCIQTRVDLGRRRMIKNSAIDEDGNA
eukprot:COSAG01_NODE_16694_length_1214_cov_0.843946_1_plen_29_part_10